MTTATLHIDDIADLAAVAAGKVRLTPDQALQLYHHAPLHTLGRYATDMANRIMQDAVGDAAVRTYVIDRNINYTNICSAHCTFCAFRRDESDHDAYVLNREQLHEKVRELVDIGGTQVLLQGGMHPDLPLSFYTDLLSDLKQSFPTVHLHAFSPPEFVELVAVCDVAGFPTPGVRKADQLPRDVFLAKLEAITRQLIDAGLASIPGGGGEIFTEHVRRRIGLGKATAQQWLDVMSVGHRLGLNTSATMMFGHIEGIADRFDHMRRVRDEQDAAIREERPGRYVSFIAWPFQRENTPLGRVPDFDRESTTPFPGDVLADLVWQGKVDGNDKAACHKAVPEAGKMVRLAGATDYLRIQAISRLFFDNIHSIGASWVTMGPKIGQLALFYGATDMGSVMMEENVVSAAGTTYCLDEPVICHLIRDAGYTPARRNNAYHILKTHDSDDAPDRRVKDWSAHRVKRLHQESDKPVAVTVNGRD